MKRIPGLTYTRPLVSTLAFGGYLALSGACTSSGVEIDGSGLQPDDTVAADDMGTGDNGGSAGGPGSGGMTDDEPTDPGGFVDDPDMGAPMPAPDPDACSPAITPEVVSQTIEIPVEVEVEVEREVITELIPAVLLLIDKSSSMTSDFSSSGGLTVSRWDTMRNFLFEGVDNLLSPLETKAFWGINHYSRARPTNPAYMSGECVGFSQSPDLVTFQLNAFASMREANNAVTPSGGTPTGEAIALSVAALKAHDAMGAEKHLILVTDGKPDTCASKDDGTPEAMKRVVDEATAAAASGIHVHAIGISEATELAHLTEVATAGMGQAHQALDSAALRQAFEEVFKNVKVETVKEIVKETKIETQLVQELSCELNIDFKAGSREDFEERGGVVLAGERLVLNDPNGWTINAAGHLELIGTACTNYKAANVPLQIQTALACELVPIPRAK